MKFYEFHQLFNNQIGPELNWDRFRQEDWRIQIREVELCKEANHIFSPWFVDAAGHLCAHGADGSNPVSLRSAIENRYIVKDKMLRANKCTPNDLFPGYALPGSQVLLLDGNHRATGHLIARRDITLRIATIVGPIQSSALPDLLRWEKTCVCLT